MGNKESSNLHRDDNLTQLKSSPHRKISSDPTVHRERTSPSSSPTPATGSNHCRNVQRSYSVPSSRHRNDSVGSHYSYSTSSQSYSMEGGYSDHGDGMSPTTFGGNYRKDVPRKLKSESFDEAHGYKLAMPLDSKQGSGFDLDWQYNDKIRRRVVANRSLNPDHPLYHKLAQQIVEEPSLPARARRTPA